jgi:hypothetical protein
MYRITSKVPFIGKIGPVPFIDGRSETDHEGVVAYCRRHGYTVEAIEQAPAVSAVVQTPRPAKSAPKDAWIEYAVASGMASADAAAATKEALVERFADEGQDDGQTGGDA